MQKMNDPMGKDRRCLTSFILSLFFETKKILKMGKPPNAVRSRVVLIKNKIVTTTACTAEAARGRIAVLPLF